MLIKTKMCKHYEDAILLKQTEPESIWSLIAIGLNICDLCIVNSRPNIGLQSIVV